MSPLGMKRGQVHLPGCVTGELTQNRQGKAIWTPDPAWEQRDQLPRLGFDFLRSPGPRIVHQDEVPPWFENLLPKRESPSRARLTSLFGLRGDQSFPLLMALGTELPGALDIRPPATAEGSPPDAEEALRPSSLAGMQLKFSMSMVNERLTLGVRSRHREWIVKFPGEYEELAEVETATMSWASQAGFEVPRHQTVPFDELEGIPDGWVNRTPFVFAIERFDRRLDGTRVHHEDLCQALGLRPLNKYGDRPTSVRYEGVLRFIHDACGESSGREFARRFGFMIASGNTDAHLKNWGLLWGDRVRPGLVPCYDLVCSIAWEKLGWQRRGGPRLALRIGTTHRFADLDDELLDQFSTETGHSWAGEEIRAGLELARNAYQVIRSPIPPRMDQALREHWNRVPLLKRLGPLHSAL